MTLYIRKYLVGSVMGGANVNATGGSAGSSLIGNMIGLMGGGGGGGVAGGIGGAIGAVGDVVAPYIKNEHSRGVVKAAASGIGSVVGSLGGSVGSIAGAGAGAAIGIASALIGDKLEYKGKYGNVTRTLDTVYDNIATGVMFIPGFGTAAGLAMKGLALGQKALNKYTGGGTDAMTVQDAILGSAFGGPLGSINGWTGKTTQVLSGQDEETRKALGATADAYAGSEKRFNKAIETSGKKYGGLSQHAYRKALRALTKANRELATRMNIAEELETAKVRGLDMAGVNSMKYELKLLGGIDSNKLQVGRNGLHLPTAEELEIIRTLLRPKETMNVIAEGALHCRKNNMDGAGTDFTAKGIPVMDDAGILQAEIECDELVFSKEITDKIEALYKDGSREAALECGKLLAYEIMENTDDRTGVIQKVHNGGVILLKHKKIVWMI